MKPNDMGAAFRPATETGLDIAPDHPAYRPDIDGLRALAVLSVVAFHAFPGALRGGFIGVDIFFVISGYLISSILEKAMLQGTFSFRDFYARRIRRIFPALALVMASCFVAGWCVLFPDELKQLGKHMLGGAGFSANVLFWNEVGYFDRGAETKPLLHLWSLGIEEQFYIAWPLLMLAAARWRARLLPVIAVIGVLSFLINVGGISRFPTATFYSPLSRAWELLLGAALASAMLTHATRPARRLPFTANARAFAGAALLALGLAVVTRERHFPGFLAVLPTLGAALLISAGPGAWFNRVVLSNRVLVWFGLISYPLYLWHWPLLSFAGIAVSQTPPAAVRAIAVALAVLLAWLTYRLLERPLRHGGGGARVTALVLAMVLTAAAGGVAYVRAGLPERQGIVNNEHNQKALVLVEDVANAAACKARYGFASIYEYCQQTRPDQDPTVALVGDSHAYHLLNGVARYYGSQGGNMLLLGTRIPYWGVPLGDDPYQMATPKLLDLVLNTASIKTVLISTVLHFHGGDGLPYVDAARDTLRRFTAAGKHVIFMDDLPWMPFEPRACIARPGLSGTATQAPCAIPRAGFDAFVAEHEHYVAQLQKEFPALEVFHPSSALCDDKWCRAMIDGRLMYRDKHHLSYDGDLYVGAAFAASHAHH